MLSESEGGKEEGTKKLEVGSEEKKKEEEENQTEKDEKNQGEREEKNKTEKEGEKKEEEVIKEGIEEVVSKLEESVEEVIREREPVGLEEERKNKVIREREPVGLEEERKNKVGKEVSSGLDICEDQIIPPASVVQSLSLKVEERSVSSIEERSIEEASESKTKEEESKESKEIDSSKLIEEGPVQVSNTEIQTTVEKSAVPIQLIEKKEAEETPEPLGQKAPTEQPQVPIEEPELTKVSAGEPIVPVGESKVSKVPVGESRVPVGEPRVPVGEPRVSKAKEVVDKMKQSAVASPSGTSMKPGTPMNVASQSPGSATPSPGAKVGTPLTPGGQMQQIVVVSSGEGSIVSSSIESMTSGSMPLTSGHNMVTVQNGMIQQQQMLMGGQGMGMMNHSLVNQGMINHSMMTNGGGHGSHPIQIVPQGTFLSPPQPMYIQSPTMFANNPNPNLITIQQPFLTQGGLSLQLQQSMGPGGVGGVNTNMGGVNTNLGGVNTNLGGVSTNMGGVSAVGGVNNSNGAKIAMPKNMTGMGGALSTINKPGVSTVVNSSGQQQVESQSGQGGLRPIFSSPQYNQGSGQFLITQQPNQSFVLSGHHLINSQQQQSVNNKSLNEGKKGVILSKNQTILPSTFSTRPIIPNLFQQQTFLQSSPFPQLTQWSGGHQQLFNGQPQLIIRNQQSGDPHFQYITNPMGQGNTLHFVQSTGQSFNTTTNQMIQQPNQLPNSPSQNSAIMNQPPGSNGGSAAPTPAKVPPTPPTGSPEKKLKPLAMRPNMSTMSTQTAVGTNSPTKVVPSIDTSKGMKSIKAGTKANVQAAVSAAVQANQAKAVVPKATSVAINTPLGKNSVVAEKGSGSKESKLASGSVSKESKVASSSVGTEKAIVKAESKSGTCVQVCTPKGAGGSSKGQKAIVTTAATPADDPNIQRPPYKRNVPVQKVEEFNAKAAQMHQQAILAAASGQMSPSMVTPSTAPTSLPLPKTAISTPNLKSTPTPSFPKAPTGGKNENNKVKTKTNTSVANTDKVPQTVNSHAQSNHLTAQSNLVQNHSDKRAPEVKVAPPSQTRQLRATRMRTQPEVLRHVIENYIIEESSHPFPVDGRTVSPGKVNGSSPDGKSNGSADQKSNGKFTNGNHDMTPGTNGSKRGFDSPALSPDSGSSSNQSEMVPSKQEKEESSISPDRCASCCKIVIPKSKFKTKNGMKVCPTCFNKRGATSAAKSNSQQLDLFNRVTSPGPLSEYDFKADNPTAISAGSKAGQLTTAGRQLSTVDRLASDHHHDQPMGPTPAKKAKGNKKQTVAMETAQVAHVQTLPVAAQPKLPPTPTTPGTFIPESGTDLQKWNVQDVYDFVRNLSGCEEFADEFKSQEIDGQALLLLKEEHLMSAMGMKLGPALKLFKKIQEIKSKNEVN